MKKTRLTIILLMILTLVSAIITLCMGAVRIPVQDTLSILLRHLFGTDTGASVSVAFEQIVWQIRMPPNYSGLSSRKRAGPLRLCDAGRCPKPNGRPIHSWRVGRCNAGSHWFALSGAGRDFRLLGLCRSRRCLLPRIGSLIGGWQNHLSQADPLRHDRQCTADSIFQLYHCGSRRFGRYDVHQVLDNGLPDPRRMEKHRPYHTDCAGGSSLFSGRRRRRWTA